MNSEEVRPVRRSFLIRDILDGLDEQISINPGEALPIVVKAENDSSPPKTPLLKPTISMEKSPIDEFLDFPSAPDRKPQRCSICGMFQDRGKLKPVEMDSEKIILIVGFVLKQKMKLLKARELAAKKQAVFSCLHHYSDVFHDIRNSLKLRYGETISSLPEDRVKELMSVVNSIRPEIKPSNFLVLFELSAVLNKHRIKNLAPIEIKVETPSRPQSELSDYFEYPRTPSPPPVPVRPPICLVCSNPCEIPREVTQGYLRLIMAIGWILTKKWSQEEVLEILASSRKLMACHSHFLETIDRIFETLGIQNEDVDLVTESNVMVDFLMRIVNILRPGTSSTDFVKCFHQFHALNRNFSMKVFEFMKK